MGSEYSIFLTQDTILKRSDQSQPEEEQVILVDEQDNSIGIAGKWVAHQRGLLHRAFSVCVIRQDREEWSLLLQQRAADKYHSRGQWTNTCCSHPRPDESLIEAGQRRLQEEMGFTLPLTVIGHFTYCAVLDTGLVEHEFDHVLLGVMDTPLIFIPNPSEVMAYRWVTISQLEKEKAEAPEQYTPWLDGVLACLASGMKTVNRV